MKKYFKSLLDNSIIVEIPPEQIEIFKKELLQLLEQMGASDSECNLVSDEMIFNSIRNSRKVEDVAWAILQ